MKTPFPGMDPYLEHPGFWRDFHQSFITYWRDWLLDHLPDHYDVRIDERLGVVEENGGGAKVMLPDLSVLQAQALPEHLSEETAIATLEREPAEMAVAFAEEETESFLRITYRPDASLLAVLELLSPTNKKGEGRQLYLQKRNEILEDNIHLVELDLLLGGARVPIKGKLPPGHYFGYVARGDQRPRCEVYAWSLAEPLTRMRLPLKPSDPDLVFDLPGVFAQAYQRGRYTRVLPYSSPPPVELSEGNAKWVNERLKEWKQQAS
jgi:hypothetical protein